MSDPSFDALLLVSDDRFLELHTPTESTESSTSAAVSMDPIPVDEANAATATNNEAIGVVPEVNEASNTQVTDAQDEPFTKRKRKKTSGVWEDCKVVKLANGNEVIECIHCKFKIPKPKDGNTTQMIRHLKSCPKKTAVSKGQLNLSVLPGTSDTASTIQNFRFDNAKIREIISHMIMVHELPFVFVEYELFNVLMKTANPLYQRITRATSKSDCLSSYDIAKKKVKNLLNTVNRVSITTDLWTSGQKIHYMVVTCHFVDSDWKLQKRTLSFVEVPPPYSGVCIYDVLYKCLKDWNIETKVASLTMDNASTNDVVARLLKDNLNFQKKLVLDGKIFHVPCCAHILNLLVQDGLSKIGDIIHNILESVKHVNASPARLHVFSDLVKQLHLLDKHLILDCSTRWNATYAMLSCALEFKDVFVMYAAREVSYKYLPQVEEWKKVEDICQFLGLFHEVTKIISGTEYPTSNLFLTELFGIKEMLDDIASTGSEYMKGMASRMKDKFDKYWGHCNLLISIAAVLDPRNKMKLIEFAFKSIYSEDEATVHVKTVQDTLYHLYQEYVDAHKAAMAAAPSSGDAITKSGASTAGSGSGIVGKGKGQIKSGRSKYDQFIRSVDTIQSIKSELDTYLEEGVFIGDPDVYFDALEWWKANTLKFRILGKMAADILSIPITTVASKSTFSAGGRVIDPYRSSLGTKTVEVLICGSDWYRHHYEIKKKLKKKEKVISIPLP